MSVKRKIILSVSVLVAMLVAFVTGFVVHNNVTTDSPNTPTQTESKPNKYVYNTNNISVRKGSGNIEYVYDPNSTSEEESNPEPVVYEYCFGNIMDYTMAITLQPLIIDTDDAVVTYFYRTEALEDNESVATTPKYEAPTILKDGDDVYLYIFIAPKTENVTINISTPVTWNCGEAGERVYYVNGEKKTETIVKGQQITSLDTPDSPGEGYYFDDWFMDLKYTTPVTLPISYDTKVYARFANVQLSPSDVESVDGGYYVNLYFGDGDWVVPSKYNNKPIVCANIRSDTAYIENVELPYTIKDIDFDSCYEIYGIDISACVNLESFVSTQGMQIQQYDFSHCTKLKTVQISDMSLQGIVLPDSVTSLNFNGCSYLTSINIPKNITTLETDAFQNCSKLSNIQLPDGLTTIGNRAFNGCSALKSVTLPSTIASIGSNAFKGCTALTSVKLPTAIQTIGDYALYNCASIDLDGCSSLTSVGTYAFYSATSLDFTDCTNLSSIGDYALASLTNADLSATKITDVCNFYTGSGYDSPLQTLKLPSTIIQITAKFSSYTTNIDLTLCTNLTTIGDNAFDSFSGSIEGIYNSTNLTTIGDNAFYGCSDVAFGSDEVSFSHTKLETIGDYAFYGGGLYWCHLPSTIKRIGDKAFSTSSLMGMDLTNCTNLQYIGSGAFEECHMMGEGIYIPESVTQIGASAFAFSPTTITFAKTSTWYAVSSESDWNNFTGGDVTSPDSGMFTDPYYGSYEDENGSSGFGPYADCYWYRVD